MIPLSEQLLQTIEDTKFYLQKPTYFLSFGVYVRSLEINVPISSTNQVVDSSHLKHCTVKQCSKQDADLTIFCFSGTPLLKVMEDTQSGTDDFTEDQMTLPTSLNHIRMGDLGGALEIYFGKSEEELELSWEIRKFVFQRRAPLITNSMIMEHGVDRLYSELERMSEFLVKFDY